MMSKKRVSLIQPNFQQGPRELNAFYLPYSVGILWCYLDSHPDWSSKFVLDQIIWRRDSIDQVAEKLSNSDIILFSTYIWNKNYNYRLAEKVKSRNPKALIIFGGPELPHRDPNIFQRLGFIDYIVKQEGELVLYNLLKNPINALEIPGLVINNNGTAIDTGDSERVSDLDQIPSPYLTGFFDTLIKNYPDVIWNATLETNRGCPYQCTFCDWGSLTYSKIKKFDLNRVFEELEWIGKHCEHLIIADANFGMFFDRDYLIASKIVDVFHKYKKIKGTNISWAKNQKSDVIKIIKLLSENLDGFGSGLTVSVQSMDDDVLDIIKRKNLNQHQLTEIFQVCEENHIPVYTEMILGLPGETLDSWKNGVFQLFEHGNHNGIDFIQAQMLVNAEMSYNQKSFYNMKTVEVFDYMSSFDELGDCPESIEIVTSTRTMPYEDMLDAQVWTSYIIAMHVNSLTTWIARFLVRYNNINYKDFYEKLYVHFSKDSWISHTLDDIRNYFQRWIEDGMFDHPPIGGVPITGINIGHRFLIDIHVHNKIDHVMDVTKDFVNNCYNLDNELLEELFKFQRDSILSYDSLASLPRCNEYKFDFLNYIIHGSDLNKKIKINFEMNDSDYKIGKQRFLENLYYGRKRFYTKLRISQQETP